MWALKRNKNACKTLVGKSEWKRPFGNCMRIKSKIRALKNLDWNIIVNDKVQDVFVLFNTAMKFRFSRGWWGRLTGELND